MAGAQAGQCAGSPLETLDPDTCHNTAPVTDTEYTDTECDYTDTVSWCRDGGGVTGGH